MPQRATPPPTVAQARYYLSEEYPHSRGVQPDIRQRTAWNLLDSPQARG